MPTKTKSTKKATERDWFSTPVYATELLLPYLRPYSLVWECAAGDGRMAHVLGQTHPVWTSDIRPPLVGDWSVGNEVWDFLKETRPDEWMAENVDLIVTNPPFSAKREFYWKCRDYWNRLHIPFALLIPADYSGWLINAVQLDGCTKIIPTRRIDYLTPNMLQRINDKLGTSFAGLQQAYAALPRKTFRKFTSSDFHSTWLTQGIIVKADGSPLTVPQTEVYVELTNKQKDNIL